MRGRSVQRRGSCPRGALLVGLSLGITSCMFPDYQLGPAAFGDAGASASGGGSNGGASPSPNGGTAGERTGGTSGAAGMAVGGGSATAGQMSGGHAGGGAPPVAGTSSNQGGAGEGGEAGEGGVGAAPGGGPLVADDFEDGNDTGWFATSGDWQVAADGNGHVYRVSRLLDQALFSVIGELSWTDVSLEARVRVLEWGGESSSDLVALFTRFDSPAAHYYVALRADGKLAIRKKQDTNITLGTPVDLGLQLGVWYLVRFEARGSELRAYLDDQLVVTVNDTALASGRIALGTDNARAEFDDVLVTRAL
jgi:hypothetical protein